MWRVNTLAEVYYEEFQTANIMILVDDCIITLLRSKDGSIKRGTWISPINYLKATDIEVGLLFNFGNALL